MCRFQVDQDGYVTEKIYNEMAKVISVKQYLDAVADPHHFKEKDIPPNAPARTSHAVYDALNREIFSISPNGLLIAKEYDANNNLTKICRYKSPLDMSRSLCELAALAKSKKARSKSRFYCYT